MGLLIDFGCGFGAEFQWWIVVGLVWWALGCGSTVGLGQSLVGLLGVSCGGSVMWWLLVVLLMVDGGWWLLVVLLMVGGGCVVDGGSMGDGVVDDGSVGGDWKFWVDRWVALFLMVG